MDNTVQLQHFKASQPEKWTENEGGHDNQTFSHENGDGPVVEELKPIAQDQV